MAHTPLPWTILDKGTVAARITGSGGRPIIADHPTENDASLLVTAPELLAALRVAVSRLETIASSSDTQTAATIKACHAVIRKAEAP
jgi:hypothetical protein